MDWRDEAKEKAALEATKHIKDNYVVGLGSGTTAAYAIKDIGRRIKEEDLKLLAVPTSYQAFILAAECGVPITTLREHPQLDIGIDGADQIDRDLNLIKGKGVGAIAREKIVASASRQMIVIADETKLVERLGENHLLPVEVLPFAEPKVRSTIEELSGKPVLRWQGDKTSPFITDNGNFILDVNFGSINNPKKLNIQLKMIPGVIETGLFIGMVDVAYIGSRGKVNRMERKR